MRQVGLAKGADLDEVNKSETVSLRVKNLRRKERKSKKEKERKNNGFSILVLSAEQNAR